MAYLVEIMSKILDAIVDARDDDDEAQMRLFFYGAGGFDSEEEEPVTKSTESDNSKSEIGTVEKEDMDEIVSTVSTLKVVPTVDISIQVQECKQRGIAHQLWPAATFLSEYIVSKPHLLVDDTFISSISGQQSTEDIVFLELGAGLGVTGIFLAKYFGNSNLSSIYHAKHTVVTDLEEAYSGLQDNIRLNIQTDDDSCEAEQPQISASVVSWGNEEELVQTLDQICQYLTPLDGNSPRRTLVVLAADVIYWECLFDPLLNCIAQLLELTSAKHNGRFATYFAQTRILIAHYKRWKKDQIFLNRCQKRLQKTNLGSFQCLHEDILTNNHAVSSSSSSANTTNANEEDEEDAGEKHNHGDIRDQSQGSSQSMNHFSTKKEIRRIYLIKSNPAV